MLGAIAAGGGFGISSLTFGTFEESLRRSRDFLLPIFELGTGDWVGVSSSPATSDLEIERDFFFTGDGEREVGREKFGVQDLRFNFVAKDELLFSRGLAVLEVVEVGVVDPLFASSTLSSAGTRGSFASPFDSVSSDKLCSTIFGLFRNSAARSCPESTELSSRSSGVFQPEESGGEASAASSEVLGSTSAKLPWIATMLVLTYLCWWWFAFGMYVYEADRGRSARKTAEGSFSFMPISAAGVLYAEALLVSPFGHGCTGCTPSDAAIVAMLARSVSTTFGFSKNPPAIQSANSKR